MTYRCNILGQLTHWGRVTHICISNLNIIGSDYGLAMTRQKAIIWTNTRILLTGPLGTNFNEFKNVVWKMAAILSQPQFVKHKINHLLQAQILFWWYVHPRWWYYSEWGDSGLRPYRLCAGQHLTHWGPDKMITIFKPTIPIAFSWLKIYKIFIEISLKFVPRGRVNNSLEFV